jgi:hypothetical protein
MVQGGLPVVEHRSDPSPTGQCHHDVAGADCGTAADAHGHGEARRVRVMTAVPSGSGHDIGWSGRHRHGRRGADGDQVMRLVVHAPDVQRPPVSPGSVFRADRLRTRTNWLPRHSVRPTASNRSVSCSTMAVLCQLTSWKRSPLASTCRSKPCDGSRDMAHEGITSRGSGGGPYWAGVAGKPDTRGPCTARPPVRARVTLSEPVEPWMCPITCPMGLVARVAAVAEAAPA